MVCVLTSAFTAGEEWEPSDIMDAKLATATAAELVRDLRGISADELLLFFAVVGCCGCSYPGCSRSEKCS